MKKLKLIFSLLLVMMLFPFAVYANEIGDFYQDINVSLNCNKCANKDTMEIKLKLFVNNKEVQNKELILNKQNNFNGYFEDLPMFEEDGITEIKYEVRFLEDGKYRSFNNNEINYKKERTTKWVSVKPEDLKPGHDYVLMTDNWYYEYNDRDPYILLDGDLYHQYVEVYPDYKIVNGKRSYYSLDSIPEDRTIWHFEKLNQDDELYEYYSGYWVLTNYNGEQLTLAGYMGDGYNSYFYKASTKNGLQSTKTYANRVNIIPIENELSRFNINSKAFWSEDHLTTLYLGIGRLVEAKAQREQEYGAHFIAFEYIDNEEVEEVYNIQIKKELCNKEEDKRTIKITSSIGISEVFKDIDNIEGINFRIADPSILKIKNGKIIPLKIGETDITFNYKYTDYRLHVKIYDLNNPNTGIMTFVVITILTLSLGFGTIIYKKHKLN